MNDAYPSANEHILVQRQHHVLHLTLNRQERKNALNLAMYTTLAEHLEQVGDGDSRVVVLSGAGGCFTAGNDLADFAEGANLTDQSNPITRFIYALFNCPVPVVVAVEGVAVGIGTTLLLHSDLVYASQDAQFRLPFANLGLCPEFASSILLPRLAGHVKAAEWLMLGEFFSAAEARHVGLVNAVVTDPLAVAMEQAELLAKQAPGALRTTKSLMKAPYKNAVEEVLKNEFEAFGAALKGPEFAEAVAAFFEKRPADFSSFK